MEFKIEMERRHVARNRGYLPPRTEWRVAGKKPWHKTRAAALMAADLEAPRDPRAILVTNVEEA